MRSSSRVMARWWCAGAVALAAAFAVDVRADEPNARWQDVVGIVVPGSTVGSGTGLVMGGLAPWSTTGGEVHVNLATGHISFQVRGLVFASGNAIGTPGPVHAVKGTLVCDTNGSASGGNSVLVDTPLVELDARGDATFSGDLGSLPTVCLAEPDLAFLIRVDVGRWIAFGAVLRR